jgi:glycosyltransferase involved in cell wall biosynthesis
MVDDYKMTDGEQKKPSIAIIGSRGIPNNYGGFEGFTEILSQNLAKKGYNVHVSCEHPGEKPSPNTYKGANLFYFPINHPNSAVMGMFYEILYDVYSLFVASIKAEQIYMLGYSAALFFFIPKLFGKKLYLNPDGFEWKRAKFNSHIKFILKVNEKLGTFWADKIIADSNEIKKYYDKKYDMESSFIAYGADEIPEVKWDNDKLPDILQHGISIDSEYWLIVARLEPENNIHTIIEGYIKSDANKPLIVVGNFSSPTYQKLIEGIVSNKFIQNKKIVFTGGIYDQESLNMLRQNCFGYIHGHSVGGTNPSLLEAMIMKNVIMVHNNQFNMEVCEDSALYFNDSDELKKRINQIENNPENYLELKDKAFNRVKNEYSWNKIVGQYHELFTKNLADSKSTTTQKNIYKNQKQNRESRSKNNDQSYSK